MNKGARTDADTDSLEEALILSGKECLLLGNSNKNNGKFGQHTQNDPLNWIMLIKRSEMFRKVCSCPVGEELKEEYKERKNQVESSILHKLGGESHEVTNNQRASY